MQLVDWRVATATGTRLVSPGPSMSLSEATAIVDELRETAIRASEHVAAFTGLDTGDHSATIAIVDRPEWIRANVEGFKRLVDPMMSQLAEKRGAKPSIITALSSRVAGAEVGALLSYLATRVLGQFELLGPTTIDAAGDDAAPSGRLTLVAPNIVSAERAMNVEPADFRLWVCLHEVTHRTQFAAAPWLQAHVQSLLASYLEASDLDPAALVARIRGALTGVVDVVLGRADASLVELLQTPEQRQILDRVTGLMSLLEGHADVVMDGVGPQVVASVEQIRERFEGRRKDGNHFERAVRRLLGVEAKLKQYAEGAVFVRAVIAAIGMEGLNQVWTSADLLPTAAEIRNPGLWLSRTGNQPAVSA